jgi:hypothetical protein
MASNVNRRTIFVEGFFFLVIVPTGPVLTCAFGTAPLFSFSGYSHGAAPNS